jgi:hypothetical protein
LNETKSVLHKKKPVWHSFFFSLYNSCSVIHLSQEKYKNESWLINLKIISLLKLLLGVAVGGEVSLFGWHWQAKIGIIFLKTSFSWTLLEPTEKIRKALRLFTKSAVLRYNYKTQWNRTKNGYFFLVHSY